MRPLFGLFLALFLLSRSVSAAEPAAAEPAAAKAPAGPAPEVIAFTPQGTVKEVQQVVARFSEAMVPFGDPKREAPFEVGCPTAGSARWIDSRAWAYEFPKALPAGIECTFRLKAGVKTLAGRALGGKQEFRFSTGGPAVRSSEPYDGRYDIDEEQIFLLRLDAEADEASIAANVYFGVEGVEERVGVQLITGGKRADLLKSQRYDKDHEPVVAIQGKQRFPTKAKVTLVWGKGVKSRTGVATEADQTLNFHVRETFTADFRCERENAKSECVPVSPMRIAFSSSIPAKDAERVTLKDAAGKSYAPKPEKSSDGYRTGVLFPGPFPENTAFTVDIPKGIEDDSGRPLANADRFPLAVKTDAFPPLAKFAADFGILEAKAAPALPVTVRNLEPSVPASVVSLEGGKYRVDLSDPTRLLYWIKRVKRAVRETSIFQGTKNDGSSADIGRTVTPAVVPKTFTLPRKAKPRDFEVVGIPLEQPGFYVVEIASRKLGESLLEGKGTMFVSAAALVTNLAVHFKWGAESSMAWVTALDTGRAVRNADVQVLDCKGAVVWKGKSDAVGVARMDRLPKQVPSCDKEEYSQYNSGVLVTARVGNDLAFVHSSWNQGIELWRFKVPNATYDSEPVLRHVVLDRSLFRAGETVHMKHFLRDHTTRGFAIPPGKRLPKTLLIRHSGTEQKWRLPLQWDASGIALSSWTIPKEAKLGTYTVGYTFKADQDYAESAGSFQVEEFRVPLMRGVVQSPAEPQVASTKLPLDVAVSYLAGGGAANAPVKLRTDVSFRSSWSFPEFEEFTFANGSVREGRRRNRSGDGEESDEESPRKPYLQTIEATLDGAGTARVTVDKLPKGQKVFDVIAELEFRDPNGEVQTVSQHVPVFPAKRLVGIKLDSWAGSKDDLSFAVAVADLKGKAADGVRVQVDLLERKTVSHRKRLVGGFYSYDHHEEVRNLGRFCEGRTDARGVLTCRGKAGTSGDLVIQATARDGDGRETAANRDVWIAGEDEWWFAVDDNDRIDVLPERKRYEPGDIAKFQVRMPFREATALVTVEREGIIDTYVRDVSGKSPVIEIPVKPGYAPNAFVSVLVVRGRSGDVQPTALVDLGRPSFRLGIGEINVGWRAHELKVQVRPDKEVYRVRGKARVTIEAKTPDGSSLPAGAEVALAAVDEGLLELSPNRSWDLLEAMMGRRGLAVETATAQMHVVGKRHFGLKALPAGGGGGDSATRELFDTLLLWRDRVRLDGAGRAVVDIPLNDSLTSFRIVAIASAGPGRFGTGSASLRTTQELMIFSGIPPLARSGDRLRANVTLRNTTAAPLEVELDGRTGVPELTLKPQTLTLAAGEAKEAGWDVTLPPNIGQVRYEVRATTKSGAADKLAVTQKVVAAVPVRTVQGTLASVDGTFAVPVERPADALPGQGGLFVALRPSLANGLSGVREYMTAYPYSCFEQETSRTVALRDRALWDKLMKKLPAYLDGAGFVKFFPSMTYGSDTLTSYVLAIAAEAGWPLPDGEREKLIGALTGFVEGKIQRDSALPTADLSLRKLAAIEALSRYPQKASAKLLESVTIEPNLWPTSAVIDWRNVLGRVEGIPEAARHRAEVDQILHARIHFQGTTVGFSTEKSDGLWWLMISADQNAVRALLSVVDDAGWKEDVPRLLQGALARQRRGHWDLTTANAWGVLAVERYAKRFESVPVAGVTEAKVAMSAKRVEWGRPETKGGALLPFPWPEGKAQLEVTHRGKGKPWAILRATAAVPLKAPFSAGFRITKTVTAVERKAPSIWTRGDIVRVSLKLQSDADMTWVVVEDPIPSGSAILGSGLATAGEKRKGDTWPAFEERSFEAFRAYYEYVGKGEWTVEYTVRLNNPGTFQLPATRVEAMYAPEMFGETPNAGWEVVP